MSLRPLRRARRVAELIALRLWLPARLASKPLDDLLASLTPAESPAPKDTLELRDVLLAERCLSRVPGMPDTCLYRALARYALLRRSGVNASFVMAVNASSSEENGHAWVEVNGKAVAERDELARYAVTFRYPSDSSVRSA